ncbi:MAG: hypothetical protein ABJA82_10610 [Myxococcales bacterium]
MLTLLPEERLARQLQLPGTTATPVQLFDLGKRYRIVAAGNVREYRDETRDCAYRARVAAVFVALALDSAARLEAPPVPPPGSAVATPSAGGRNDGPPAAAPAASPAPAPPALPSPGETVAVPAPTMASPPDAPAGAATAQAVPSENAGVTAPESSNTTPPSPGGIVTVEAAVGGSFGFGNGELVALPAIVLGMTVGRGDWAGTGGIVAAPAFDGTAGGSRLREWRLPGYLAVRHHFERDGWAPYADGGLCLALHVATGTDLVNNQTARALEFGIHAGVGIRLGRQAARFTPFGLLVVDYFPWPSAISVLPRGEVGHTSSVWMGAAFGVSINP